ncbi:MAG: hypothetical protein V4724_39995 [Pseudomonadota bacterium]
MNSKKALLLVMMEPPAALEEEFHDWYDSEHLPQRRSLPGVESGARWICLEGWPRWMAMYDLASSAVLETPEYAAVSGPNSTPWSKRILPRTVGRSRVTLQELADHSGVIGEDRAVARLLLMRFPHVSAQGQESLMAEISAMFGQQNGLLQIRYFSQTDKADNNLYALAAFDRVAAPSAMSTALQQVSSAADIFNYYAPYHRA